MHKISKNENISNFDPNQISGLTFDNARDAVRVHIVDGLTISGENLKVPSTQVQVINVPEIIKETQIQQVEVPVIVREYEKIEVPVIIKEIEYKTIEVPVVIREVQVIEIEKPVIVTEFKVIEKIIPVIPSYVNVCMIVQAAAIVGLLLTSFLKGR